MPDLPPVVADIVDRLARIEHVLAVALGGSRARGTHRPDSDIDLGLYYRDESPFAVDDLVALAGEISDAPDPVVTDFYRWGPWVNGGAWLTVGGQRVDFLYRSLDRIERVIADCLGGKIESDFYQQPPYGFHSYIYLGELSICRPLCDPDGVLARLKERILPYPQPLKRAVINRFLWGCEFDLAHAAKLAQQGDVYNAVGCFTRVAAQMVQVLYALNERYFVGDKGALDEIEGFDRKPLDLTSTLTGVLAHPGDSSDQLGRSASRIAALLQQLIDLCGGLYSRPSFGA